MTEMFDLNEVEIAAVSGGREQTWWEWLNGIDPGRPMETGIKG